MMKIPLRNKSGEIVDYALVSDEDYNYLNLRRWHRTTGNYAVSSIKKNKKLYMHRVVYERAFGPPMPKNIDHKDRDALNNQRGNIRAATGRENCLNRSVAIDSETGYHAVRRDKRTGRFQAFYHKLGKWCSIGYFSTPREAAIARDLRLKEVAPLEFIVLNCPDATEIELRDVLGQLHSAKKRNGRSRFRGVILHDYDGRAKPWLGRINVAGKNYCLGYYKTEKEAAMAYNRAASELLGEKAMLNDISAD